ncbi:ATP-binding protein [Aquimarina sp. BL5]|uniref:ATP-dependent nuclease n=1 Tax=Aquimarina sp. BL5 TaxID=1714860 RepID=UPI000E4E6D3D|nr:AAA family ATPase [Aquimarina sp. BL5]AXT51356.1 ATP-binding protein [Aquimarina sp. BL5]RKN09854.1 ATP-binding protein [Aquimarina sp. BL5]
MELDSKITFDFPLTIFIGQNGCGKSSSLHALYGAPDRYTPYQFWFDTKVDPVDYYNNKKKRHSFWYGFVDDNGVEKEVLKARIRRENDPNYWETSRPLKWAGMKTRKNKNDRDSPIKKKVVYLDFRAELSAFDKFFYFGNVKDRKSKNKQEFIRTKSASLKKLLEKKKKFINSSTRQLNDEVEVFSQDILKAISFILGREYTSGVSVYHELFRNEGYSVLFNTSYAKYSEAFAGSGEMAVFRLVTEVLSAPDYSLILLDEPEVSLHPGAQKRLRDFLLQQIIKKKHQIVLTTHSPSIAKGMPNEALKVFYQNPNTGRFFVKENLSPKEAFFYVEYPQENKKNLIVEDILAQNIIEGVLDKMGEATRSLYDVKFNPGGETVIKKEFTTVYSREPNSKNYILFDGDQKPPQLHYNWRDFKSSDLTITNFTKKIKDQTGENIKFSVDGGSLGGNKSQQIELLKSYLDYYLANVFYLPKNIPEEIIWDSDMANKLISVVTSSSTKLDEYRNEIESASSFKEKYAKIALITQGISNSETIASIHKMFLKKWLSMENQDYQDIKKIITKITSI